ncbi:MAG TPA: class I SAM-dependent methyltransferase, partial [Thermohalobaculum sp.]|nr:class I SAM-dependent methyltransferase [Thermohalobaculum sp.]
MTGFSADWLALRAGADARARDPGLAARLSAAFAGREGLRVLDLGAGTGANLRATAPLIGAPQHWVLADHDADLLAQAAPVENTTVETRCADLARGLPNLFEPPPDLVTASAFLDLCGAAWLDQLAGAVVRHRAALYTVLSYDGREIWRPPHPLDAPVLTAFHA